MFVLKRADTPLKIMVIFVLILGFLATSRMILYMGNTQEGPGTKSSSQNYIFLKFIAVTFLCVCSFLIYFVIFPTHTQCTYNNSHTDPHEPTH